MPNAPETRRDDHGTSRRSEIQQTVNLFQFPTVYSLGTLLRDEFGPVTNRGARSPYTHASLLAVVTAIRAHRSLARTLKNLWEGNTWERCSEAHEAMTGLPLPATPPTRDQVTTCP